MPLFSSLARKLVEFKYQYYGLNIIQEVPKNRFHFIIALYVERGWEISGEYFPINSSNDSGNHSSANSSPSKWSCKLRKGTSTLLCEWCEESDGSFIAPERIVFGLGQEFGLTPSKAPLLTHSIR